MGSMREVGSGGDARGVVAAAQGIWGEAAEGILRRPRGSWGEAAESWRVAAGP